MKLTKSKLQQIINEEMENILDESWEKGLDPKYIPDWDDDPKTTAPKPKRRRRKHSVRIESIQQYLEKFGYDLGPHGADGYKGPDTRNAIEQFQRDNDLKPDGIVGRNTINKMEQVNNDLARAEKPKKQVRVGKSPFKSAGYDQPKTPPRFAEPIVRVGKVQKIK